MTLRNIKESLKEHDENFKHILVKTCSKFTLQLYVREKSAPTGGHGLTYQHELKESVREWLKELSWKKNRWNPYR